MNTIIRITLLIFLSSCSYNKSTGNSIARKKVEQRLVVLKKYLKGEIVDSSGMRVEAISFFEELTKIQSQSDGNYFGKFDATNDDYVKWSNWYKVNKKKLDWDKPNQKVIYKK